MGLTTNLFWGSGEGDFELAVRCGEWPSDLTGNAYIIGPDQRQPGRHWLSHHGMLYKISCVPNSGGAIEVKTKLVNNPIQRIRKRFPRLFKALSVMEMSPFGTSNLANTNLQPMGARLFVGYDIGRPIEVDANTLDYRSVVGKVSEWCSSMPGFLENLISVAAHPGADLENNQLYFINYSFAPDANGAKKTYIAQWDLKSEIRKWPLSGITPYSTVHDIKISDRYIVFSDFPFNVDQNSFRGTPRKKPNQDFSQLWIIKKSDLESTPPEKTVPTKRVVIDKPVGHLLVDLDDANDLVTVILQHATTVDLPLSITPKFKKHSDGKPFPKDIEGFSSIGPQPAVVGKYVINGQTGEVVKEEVLADDSKNWNALLWTSNAYYEASLRKNKHLWYSGLGYDPDLVSEAAYNLYKGDASSVVDFQNLPTQALPASIVKIDLESMNYVDEYQLPEGSFAHPIIFIPKESCQADDDGYVLALINKDGMKEFWLFDAADVSAGPIAKLGHQAFNPPMLLHSCWMPEVATAKATYRVNFFRDFFSNLRQFLPTLVYFGKRMKGVTKPGEITR